MTAIDFIVCFFVATLSGLGVGSGGLLIIYLTLVRGEEQIFSQGVNLAFFVLASLASFVINVKQGRINFRLLSFMSVFGLIGVAVGSLLLPCVPRSALRHALGYMLIFLSLTVVFEKRIKRFFDLKRMKNKNNSQV